MTNDLGALLPEVEAKAKELGLVLFHGRSRLGSTMEFIEWDTDRRSDFKEFFGVAVACDVKLICVHDYKFESEELAEALGALKDADITPQERRQLEKQLNALEMYVGFTCGMELAFDYQDNVYFFHLRTPWRTEFIKLMSELDDQIFDSEIDGEDEPMGGGYFSRN